MAPVVVILTSSSQTWPFDDAQSPNDVRLITPSHHTRPEDEDAFELLSTGNGAFTVEWTHPLGQSLSPDARHVAYSQASAYLCNACRSALGYLAQNLGECIDADDAAGTAAGDGQSEAGKKSVIHHHNFMAFFSAANRGCQLCSTIWARRFRHNGMARAPGVRTEFCWNTTEGETWREGTDRPGDARLICNMVMSDAADARTYNKYTWETIFRFQLWPSSPAFDRFFEKVDGLADRGNTRSSRPLALRWMAECKANADGEHAECQGGNDAEWYPTRLLDLSKLEETGKVFLAVTEKLDRSSHIGPYITLSHCWGEWGAKELPVLTTSKIDERVNQGMEMSMFPPTFRDAIEVAGWFGARWLWIDSLCIIQDSRTDWQQEAPMMCDVYQNALLNISADHAVDAREGCFRDRPFAIVDPFQLRLKPLDSSWWVTVDERNLFEWVHDAPSSTRAWIYQERHLARRVLHFTEHEVIWECRAPSFRSETYPHGSPLRRSFLGQTKLQLRDISEGSITDNPTLLQEWDAACAAYSRRKLTYQTDRLPALSGIARHFASRIADDTYLAGIWASQLPHALFWSVPTHSRPDTRPPPLPPGIPSWSWMAVSAPTVPSRVGNSTCHFVSDIAKIIVAEINYKDDDDPFGELPQASLHVFGLVRRIATVMEQIVAGPAEPGPGAGEDAYTSLSRIDPAARSYRRLYVDGRLDRDVGRGPSRQGLHQFGEMRDWFRGLGEAVEYHCLLMAVTQNGPRDDRVLRGLLLEPVEGEEAVEGEKRFRRVGHIFFRGRCALKMRYRLRQQDNGEDRTEEEENAIWNRLWERAVPYWGEVEMDVAMGREANGPTMPVNVIGGAEPWKLYGFDGDVPDNAVVERLRPEVVTLI